MNFIAPQKRRRSRTTVNTVFFGSVSDGDKEAHSTSLRADLPQRELEAICAMVTQSRPSRFFTFVLPNTERHWCNSAEAALGELVSFSHSPRTPVRGALTELIRLADRMVDDGQVGVDTMTLDIARILPLGRRNEGPMASISFPLPTHTELEKCLRRVIPMFARNTAMAAHLAWERALPYVDDADDVADIIGGAIAGHARALAFRSNSGERRALPAMVLAGDFAMVNPDTTDGPAPKFS